MLAVANHRLVNVSLLVSLDTDCMKTRNKNKRSVLHYSAASINTEIASVLLKASKSPDKLPLIFITRERWHNEFQLVVFKRPS